MINMLVNIFIMPVLGLVCNLVCAVLVSCCFYSKYHTKHIVKFFEIMAVIAIIKLIELFGTYFADLLLHIFDVIPKSNEVFHITQIAFSSILSLLFYFVFLERIGNKKNIRTKIQYILFFAICTYNISNIIVAATILNYEETGLIYILAGNSMFANIYLLWFISISDERNFYKLKVEMLNQQVNLQYADYETQRERNVKTMAILHDVDKHLAIIERLYERGMKAEASEYTRQMKKILRPYVPIQYTTNPVLNCLLSDKYIVTEESGIEFYISVLTVDINFMKAIDITTLFGNLIDNAITACKKCDARKYIGLNMEEYNEIITIRIENSISEPVMIKYGMIIGCKGELQGIGMLNIKQCVEKYEGSIFYNTVNDLLTCNIILNK